MAIHSSILAWRIAWTEEPSEFLPGENCMDRGVHGVTCEKQYIPTGREGRDGGCLWKLPTTLKIEKNFTAEKDLKDHLIQISHFIEEKKNK